MPELMITVERTVTGRLRAAYPASRYDVELRVSGASVADLPHVLAAEAESILELDPSCRKVVFAAPAGDAEIIAAAEAAGFRYVVDVDIPDDRYDPGRLPTSRSAGRTDVIELSLLVREPSFVTEVDMDLDHVPHT